MTNRNYDSYVIIVVYPDRTIRFRYESSLPGETLTEKLDRLQRDCQKETRFFTCWNDTSVADIIEFMAQDAPDGYKTTENPLALSSTIRQIR